MAEKVLNTRILLKYDTYANWTTNNPVLKQGEMAIATVANNDNNVTATGFTNLPNIVLKVGDGTSTYNQLKFVSALAADVHGWAKAADKPTYGYNEITGLEQFIRDTANSEIKDTDTQYTLVATDADNYKYELRSKGLEDAGWTKVADLDLSGIVSRVAALEAKFAGMTEATVVAHVEAKIAGLDAAEVKVGNGEILESVSEADGVVTVTKRALKSEDFAEDLVPEAAVAGLTERLAGIDSAIGNAQSGSLADAKAYTDAEIQKLDYNGGEFGEHKFASKVTEADGVVSVEYAQPAIADVSGLETRLADIEGDVTDLGNNKQDNLGFEGTYNKETNKVVTKAHLTEVIEGLDSDGAGFGEHKFVTKVTEADGIVTPVYAQPVIADIDGLSGEISRLDGRIDGKQDQLYFTSTPDNADNKVATQTYVNEAVANLEGAMHFIGKLDSLPASGEGYAAGDVIMVPDAEDANVMVEYVLDKTGTWQKLGHESIYELKADAKTKHEVIEQSIADLGSRHDTELAALTKKHNDELAALDAAYKEAIAGLDKADTAVAGEFVTAVSEADGVITVSRAALQESDIPELAQSKITGLTDKLAEIEEAIGTGSDGALTDAKAYTDERIEGLDYTDTAVEKQFVTAVSEADGVITVTRAALQATDIPVIEQAQVNGLDTALANAAKAGTDAAAQALTDAKAYTDEQIQGLDVTDTAVEKNVVTAVSQTDGAISVTRAPLADIAWSGDVKDLKQTDTVLVFNCGNSQIGTANEFVM